MSKQVQMQKNLWILVGICTLIATVSHVATIRVNQKDVFGPHVEYLIEKEVQTSVK